ncbi:MAG: tetratricopeptide repeat protein [Alphaproteobacteria bacterium]
MTVVTQHLGELMGRGDSEVAGGQQAAQSADAAGAASQSVNVSAAGATQSADAAGQVAHTMPAHALDAYAFPFQSHEVFGLLPHSIGDKAESLWTIAHQLATTTSALSLAVGGVLLGAVAVATFSTARVWRRGEEFAVASFGDRLTKVGTRYAVRQDAPISAFADKHGVVRKPKKANADAPVTQPTEESVGEAELQVDKAPAPQPPEPSRDTWRSRRASQGQKNEVKQPAPAPQPKEVREVHIEPIVALPEPEPIAVKRPAPKPAAAPAPAKKTKEVEREAAPPLVATDEAKRPKTVRRQLFRRSNTTVNYAGAFHGSYGSFQQTDRLFARDYLKQTNDAFEAAYLKGKGPNLAVLKVGDNHRAERLFMMATRASFEDSQTALAALWQAVDEDRTDAVAWLRLAHFYLELGEFDHARHILEPLKAQADHLGLHIIVAAAANSLGKIAAQRGDLEGARKLFSASIDNAQKTDNPFMQAVAHANAGLLEASRKRFEPARSLLQRGVKGFESSEERVSAARTKLALGIVHTNTGDDEAAEKVWNEAAETLRNSGFEDEAAQAQRWLAGEGTPNAIIL